MADFREPSAPPPPSPPSPTPPPPAYSEVCPLNSQPSNLPPVHPSPRSKLMIAGLVVLALLLLVLLVTVIGLVLEVISLRTILRSLDHDSVGEVKGSVRRLESNMNNSTKYYLTKLNSLYKRVAVLEAERSSSERQMLVSPEVFLITSACSLLFYNWSQMKLNLRLPSLPESNLNWPQSCSSS